MTDRTTSTSSTGRALPAPVASSMVVLSIPATIIVILLGVRYAGDDGAGRLDGQVQAAVDGHARESRAGALLVDAFGEPLAVVVLAALLALTCLCVARHRLALVALLGTGATGVTTTVLKPLVERTIHGEHLAYPSGHTAAVTALALVAALLVVDLTRANRLSGLLVVVVTTGTAGLVMTWAQVVLRAHYPTDAVGGFCTAIAVVTASAVLVDHLAGLRHSDS
jgi:membrane-associated phospholipid phosphatase